MNIQQIQQIMRDKAFPDDAFAPRLIETHISWLILTDRYAFKIKKPQRFSFLDFSTLSLRRYYCRRELLLNARLAPDMYIRVLPVMQEGEQLSIGGKTGQVVDYALQMKRMDTRRQMDQMMERGEVQEQHLLALAEVLADFHANTRVLNPVLSLKNMRRDFNDIRQIIPFLQSFGQKSLKSIIERALSLSDQFLSEHFDLLERRIDEGFVRDGHGDLHTGNIFLYAPPVVFDCVEFNDELRQIDVLNDIAYLCMDLDAQGHSELASVFLQHYLSKFPAIGSHAEHQLFVYYKLYRANVRAKVLMLRAMGTGSYEEANACAMQAGKYIHLMQEYLEQFNHLHLVSL